MKDILGREIEDLSNESWWGEERNKIEWYPKINSEKCINCGICFITCKGKKVFDWDIENNNPVVARPYNCMVGCNTCAMLCPVNAINFPDKSYLDDLVKRVGAIKKAKNIIENTKG
jgi:NAD-dependent dihydropyrimidine dehydrogenase PreA subunit